MTSAPLLYRAVPVLLSSALLSCTAPAQDLLLPDQLHVYYGTTDGDIDNRRAPGRGFDHDENSVQVGLSWNLSSAHNERGLTREDLRWLIQELRAEPAPAAVQEAPPVEAEEAPPEAVPDAGAMAAMPVEGHLVEESFVDPVPESAGAIAAEEASETTILPLEVAALEVAPGDAPTGAAASEAVVEEVPQPSAEELVLEEALLAEPVTEESAELESAQTPSAADVAPETVEPDPIVVVATEAAPEVPALREVAGEPSASTWVLPTLVGGAVAVVLALKFAPQIGGLVRKLLPSRG